MANTFAPFGFRKIGVANGAAPTFALTKRRIASGNSTAIYFGDPVMPVISSANGYITQGAAGTTRLDGIFAGCKYLSVAQKRTVWSNYYPGGTDPATGTIYAYIINDPNAKFLVQSDSTGVAAVDVNATIGFKIGSGNTANGISGAYLDLATLNTGTLANFPFKIVGILNDPPGAPGTLANGQAYDQAIVMFNNVFTRNAQGV